MSKSAHFVYIALMTLIVLFSLGYLFDYGYKYYKTGVEQRYYFEGGTGFFSDTENVYNPEKDGESPVNKSLKPSGAIGHGLGIVGTLIIIVGVFIYMARKRIRRFSRVGILKYWLEFHIFMCTLGPILVLFHTAFKFGGIVSISFWSMVAVFLSGVIGRFIYIQIPHSIEGRELSLTEIRDMKTDLGSKLSGAVKIDDEGFNYIVDSTKRKIETISGSLIARTWRKYRRDSKTVRKVAAILKNNRVQKIQRDEIMQLVKNEISLNRRIDRLQTMQSLFKYWHVAHLPFAIIMLIIMIIHVGVTLAFGFKWIF